MPYDFLDVDAHLEMQYEDRYGYHDLDEDTADITWDIETEYQDRYGYLDLEDDDNKEADEEEDYLNCFEYQESSRLDF